MSTSELFTMRNKIQKCSIQQFQKYLKEQKKELDSIKISNLFLSIYPHKKQIIDYVKFFMEFSHKDQKLQKSVLNIQVGNGRRLLEDICYHCRVQDFRELIQLFISLKAPLRLYTVHQLAVLAIQGRCGQDSTVRLICQLAAYRQYFPESQEQCYLCLKALRKDMLLLATQIIKLGLGHFSRQHQQLFALPHKISKRDFKNFQNFLLLYFQRTRANPYVVDTQGRHFWSKMSKDLEHLTEQIIHNIEVKMQQKQPVRRSQNKVRSSMGQGQNIKQYNSEALQQNSRQKMVINIQNSEDELSVQRQANKIYQNLVIQKEKYYKIQKKQKKEATQKHKRTGIMKSDQLRYYLQQDIKLQVQQIKQQNRQYKQYFQDLIHKLKQKLSSPLNITLQVFGSFRTQLCLQESDIDIAITSDNEQSKSNPIKLLGEIQFILTQEEMKEYIDNVKFIKTATVPIIKVTCTEKYWRKKIDFTYQDVAHNGLQSVELIKHYLSLYPQLQSLIFVLKKFIYLSNLSAPYLGGISSYGLILMIVAYIQQQYKLHEDKGQKLLTSDLLIGFLQFYGYKMNYVMKCIQVFDKNKINWQNYNSCVTRYNDPNGMIDFSPKLVIIDPLNQNNNVGRPTHKIKQIQMAFQIACISIHTFRQCGKKRRCASYRKISKLQINDFKYADNSRPCCILKRMFGCTQKFIKE